MSTSATTFTTSDDDFFICDHCGDTFPLDDARETPGRSLYCEACFDENFTFCDHCGEAFPHEDARSSTDDDVLCPSCADRYCVRCADCDVLVREDRSVGVEGDVYYVCDCCYERAYFTCANCDRVYPDSEYAGDGLCDNCAEDKEVEGLHDYSYKPTPLFHKSLERDEAPLYFGVELEYSHVCLGDAQAHLNEGQNILNPRGEEENFYYKEDSSLSDGIEAVSHPRTLASWHEFHGQLEDYFAVAQSYALPPCDGLHIHISRKRMMPGHKLRFGTFFHTFQHELYPVARRESKYYAEYKPIPKTGKDALYAGACSSRYEAVNWKPHSTVEVRIFKSTFDIDTFYVCLELCHAVYQFTKRCTSVCRILSGKAWDDFLLYIAHDSRYTHLKALLSAHYVRVEDEASLSLITSAKK